MNTFILRQAIDKFLMEIEGANKFIEHVRDIAEYANGIDNQLALIALGGDNRYIDAGNKIRHHFINFGVILEKISHRQFFKELEFFNYSLLELKAILDSDNNFDFICRRHCFVC